MMRAAIRAAFERTRAFLRRGHEDREFDEEIGAHLDLSIAEYRRRGLSPDEARRAALIALGGVQPARDLHRDTRGLPSADRLLQDVRYALRTMRRNPGFAVTAVLILALGIGANTLVFSVVDTILLRRLPFQSADSLAWIANESQASAAAGLSGVTSRVATLEEWQHRLQSFEALTGYDAFFAYKSYKLAGPEPERVAGVAVASNFFDVLGVPLLAGRSFTAAEASAQGPRAVVLSHALWQRRFASDPTIVGRQITLDDRPATVVGVLPRTFDFGAVFAPGVDVDIVRPLVFEEARTWGNTLAVIGRLRPGVTVDASRTEMAAVMPQIVRDHPEWGGSHGGRIVPLQEHVSGAIRPALVALAVAVGMVLLIVCANLSNLMLSRGAARQREIAIRGALGAGRGRLVRQLLTEAAVLAAIGAALGLAAALAGARMLSTIDSLSVPLLAHVAVDLQAAAFTAAIAIAAALAAGLAPALQLSRTDVQHVLKDAARGSTGSGHRRLRAGLVVAEVALACVLVVGAGLLLRSFGRLMALDLGFDPARAIAVKIEPSQTVTDREARRQFAAEAVRRVAALPAVEAVGLTDALPLDRDRAWGIEIPGRTFSEADAPIAHLRVIGGEYFRAMGVRLLEGRPFTEAEWLSAPDLVVVNETMARTFWPEGAVGNEVRVGGRLARIIGVAVDVRHSAVEKGAGFEMYLPLGRFRVGAVDLVVRSALPPSHLAPSLRSALRTLDPSMPVAELKPLAALVDRAVSPRRFYTGLLAAFAAIAIVLASLGIFGVISYSVSQRTAEIGIRIALGATPSAVRREVVRHTLTLAILGVFVGAAVSLVVSRGLSSLLFGVTTTDPMTFALAAAVMIAVAALAGYLPARRASRVDPLLALRG